MVRVTDTDLTAAARIVAALAEAVGQTPWRPECKLAIEIVAKQLGYAGGTGERTVAAALLDAARRELAVPEIERLRGDLAHSRAYADELLQDVRDARAAREPRVWLPGDTVPAGVWVTGGPIEHDLVRQTKATHTARWALVEVLVPDFAAAVAAEQARRAATDVLNSD